MDPLTRVQQLMSLALNNSFTEEARSSAVAAVRLIRDHGFVVTDPKTVHVHTPFRAPSPKESRGGVEAGDYDLEVESARYAGTNNQRHLFKVDFTIRAARIIQDMVGLSFSDAYDFQTPLHFRTRQFVQASGYDFPDQVIPELSLTRWSNLIRGTRYHATIGPSYRGGPLQITRIAAWSSHG